MLKRWGKHPGKDLNPVTPHQHVHTQHTLYRCCGMHTPVTTLPDNTVKHPHYPPPLIISVTEPRLNIMGISSPSSSFICQYFLVMNIPQVTIPSRHSCAPTASTSPADNNDSQNNNNNKNPQRWFLGWKERPYHKLNHARPTVLLSHWPASASKQMAISDKGSRLNYKWTIADCWAPLFEGSTINWCFSMSLKDCFLYNKRLLWNIHILQENYASPTNYRSLATRLK